MQSYRFGTFLLERAERRLRDADGAIVPLTPRLFDALTFFVEHAGQLLDKDTLLSALWAGVIVEENSLSQMVSALRRALGDDAQASRYIQTVPRRGFRFIAIVAPGDSGPASVAPTTDPAPGPADAVEHVVGRVTRRWWLGGAGAALAMGTGAALWWHPFSGGALVTLAVLPFRPLAMQDRDEALEIGIADSLVTRLSPLPGVVVRSIGSSRRYAGPDQDPLQAARELDTEWVLDGSIQRVGARLRVAARLLDARSGQAAWSGTFDEADAGLFDLQDTISARVAEVLAPRLGARQREHLVDRAGTRNIDAYQFYVAARHQAQGIRTAGLVKSIELFNRAIKIDPAYALAYAGLAESYRRMIFGADGEPRVVFAAAKECAHRAIGIDPGLATGFASEGWNRFWNDWDWQGAEDAFRHAIALNPNEVNAHFGYGQLLDMLGRDDEASRQMRTARELDPESLISLTLESAALYGAGNLVAGREHLQRVFDLEPDFWVAHLTLAGMLAREKRYDEAIAELQQADRQSDGSSQPAAFLGHLLAHLGRASEARSILARFADQENTRYVPPTSSALIHAGLGERDATLRALESGHALRDVRMTLVASDDRFRFVRDDPRYRAIMRRMNLKV